MTSSIGDVILFVTYLLDNMARLYGYCRKSTEEQNETSSEVQERKNLKKSIIIFLYPVDIIILSMILSLYNLEGERNNVYSLQTLQ